ncbi:NAD-dependent epimerase/dehydratase family protein [Lichenihabitans psoromatis]|uniref:NAD-dependent epimerase/dehydratase family protein n=1 Tax=Lichenihabitans psoromatis TaxID=2528642 RepID=UPI0010385228|nr:NAD-dependent epimerase/dehydratase family protein [Lichenihabitans psoromatis]
MIQTPSSDLSGLSGRRCLVLGGGGFIGARICEALCNAGASVEAFGRRWSGPGLLDPRVTFTQGLFDDALAVAKAVRGQQIVIHLLGGSIPESSNLDPLSDLKANVGLTLTLLDICHREGVRKIIFASSGGTVYGIPARAPIPETASTDPISAYGISKLACEKYFGLFGHLYGLDYQVLRLANPYGPTQSPKKKQGVVAAMLHRALTQGKIEIWGDGSTVRDFIHIDDVVSAFLTVMEYSGPERVMNVGSGVGLSIREVATDVIDALGVPVKIVFMPGQQSDVPVNVLDINRIIGATGWSPRRSWKDGLRATADVFQRTLNDQH